MVRRVLWVSACLLVACGSQPEQRVCGVGDTRACLGPGACSGAQACLEDGSGFGVCDCGGPITRDDAGSDAGQMDSGVSDAGMIDAGTDDAGIDAGTNDDAGTTDAGPGDAGTSDAGADDAGPGDAGTNDAGVDAGPPTSLDVEVHRTNISTEVGRTSNLIVTLTASNGFGGRATLNLEHLAADGGVSDWSFTVADAGVDVPVDGSATNTTQLSIPSDSRDLDGLVRVSVASAAQTGVSSASAQVAITRQYTIQLSVAGGACVYPPAGNVPVLQGTTVRWLNVGAMDSFNIHTSGAGLGLGCPHQPTIDSVSPGAAYTCVTMGSGTFSWDCHSPGPSNAGLTITVSP